MHANAESPLIQPLQGLIQLCHFNVQPHGQRLHYLVVLPPQKKLVDVFRHGIAGRLQVRACPLAARRA
jgi:hypothetical protein